MQEHHGKPLNPKARAFIRPDLIAIATAAHGDVILFVFMTFFNDKLHS